MALFSARSITNKSFFIGDYWMQTTVFLTETWLSPANSASLCSECRRAERKWRKHKLTVHHDIHKEHISKYNKAVRDERRTHLPTLSQTAPPTTNMMTSFDIINSSLCMVCLCRFEFFHFHFSWWQFAWETCFCSLMRMYAVVYTNWLT